MTRHSRILVAGDAPADAEVVRRLLEDEFEDISTSTDPMRAVADFEAKPPSVLVLAFRSVEAAERYSLGLYRLGTVAHAVSHATVLLCTRDEVRRAYELCRSQHFDDYVLFWPVQHDAHRLPMAVHNALRRLGARGQEGVSLADFARQAQRVVELEQLLEQSLASGGARIDGARELLDGAGRRIAAALEHFASDLPADATAASGSRLDDALARFKQAEIEPELDTISGAVTPLGDWVDGLRSDVEPHLASLRTLKALADEVRPLVLVVDDDEFQKRLLQTALAGAGLEVIGVSDGAEALRFVAQRHPALILMDIDLPDQNGIEVTRRIKSLPQHADIRIVMVSGHRERDKVVESLRAGACDFLVKPCDRVTLLARVARWLGRVAPQEA